MADLESRERALEHWRLHAPDWLIAQFLLEEPGSWWRDKSTGVIYSFDTFGPPTSACPLGIWYMGRVSRFHVQHQWDGLKDRVLQTPVSASLMFDRLPGEPSEEAKLAYNRIYGSQFGASTLRRPA